MTTFEIGVVATALVEAARACEDDTTPLQVKRREVFDELSLVHQGEVVERLAIVLAASLDALSVPDRGIVAEVLAMPHHEAMLLAEVEDILRDVGDGDSES